MDNHPELRTWQGKVLRKNRELTHCLDIFINALQKLYDHFSKVMYLLPYARLCIYDPNACLSCRAQSRRRARPLRETAHLH